MVLFPSLPFPLWSGSCLQARACLAPPSTSPVPSTERACGGLYRCCWTTNTVNKQLWKEGSRPAPPEGCPDCSDRAAVCPAQLSPHLSWTQAPLVSAPPPTELGSECGPSRQLPACSLAHQEQPYPEPDAPGSSLASAVIKETAAKERQ